MRTMRARCGWYGLALRTGWWVATSSASNILYPPQAVDHLYDIDADRAGADAPPAAYAARPAVFGHKAALFVIEAEFDAAGARPAKVFAAGHQCMAGEQAGVPGARAPPGPRPQFHVVGDIIAVARGADHAATAAGEALLSQLLPDLALVFHLEDLGKVADLHLELERAALVPGAPLVVVDICLLYTSPSPRDRQKSRMPSS